MNNSIYKRGLAVALIIALIIMASVGIKLSSKEKDVTFNKYGGNTIDENNGKTIPEQMNDEENKTIIVDVDGAVKNPGVYELKLGQRVNDAVEMAGGFTEKADTKNFNKARKLADGEKIYVREQGEETADSSLYDESAEGKVNINNASKEMLMSLDGIGEVYAERIIEYREKIRFSSIEDIKKIKGIGDKTFENIKDLITVE